MAEEKKTTIIEIQIDDKEVSKQLSENIKHLKELKEEQKLYKQEIEKGNDVNGEYAKKLAETDAQIKETSKSIKSQTALLQASNLESVSSSDSLERQRQALATLQTAYANLSGEEKEAADAEGGLRDKIKELYESVNEQSQAIGDNRANIGNYTESIQKAIPGVGGLMTKMNSLTQWTQNAGAAFKGTKGGFSTFTSGMGQATKASLKFIATPIGAIIMAIVVVVKLIVAAFKQLSDAFKRNDDAGTALSRVYAVTIQPIINAVKKAFDALASAIGAVANVIADWFGGNSEAAKAADDLVKAIDKQEDREREYAEEIAKNNVEIAKLRDQAVDKEKYTAKEREKFLQQAVDLEKDNLAKQRELKKEDLRILEETAKQNSDTSDEMKKKISDARVAMLQAEEDYYTGVKRLNSQIQTLRDEEARSIEEEKKKHIEEEKKRTEEIQKERERRAKNLSDAQKGYADAYIAQIQDETTRQLAEEARRYDEQKKNISEKLGELKKDETEARKLLHRQMELLEADHEQKILDIKQAKIEQELAQEAERNARKLSLRQELENMILQNAIDANARQLEQEQLTEEQRQVLEEQRNQLLYAKEQQEYELKVQQLRDRIEGLGMEEIEARASIEAMIEAEEQAHYDRMDKIAEDSDAMQLERTTKTLKTQTELRRKNMSSLADSFGTLSDTITKYGNDDERITKASKILALGKIAIDTGVAIAEGTTMAMSLPFPANLAAVITTVATIMSNIAAAKDAVNEAGFQEGGVVGGSSYSGDKIGIRVNSGEGIMTGVQANNVLQEVANNPARGGFDYDRMGEVLQVALRNMPAPVLVYSEFQEFENNVNLLNEKSKL